MMKQETVKIENAIDQHTSFYTTSRSSLRKKLLWVVEQWTYNLWFKCSNPVTSSMQGKLQKMKNDKES
jgi:hypothetical protein